jgi:hypothetical protein
MKKLLLLTLMFFEITSYSQLTTSKKMEQMMDKYCVQSATILNRTFSVGDTIYFLNGSSPYGDYLCSSISMIAPGNGVFAIAITGQYNPGTKKLLGVEYSGRYLIINKIRELQEGLDHMVQLVNVLPASKNVTVIISIDPYVGLTRKEIK